MGEGPLDLVVPGPAAPDSDGQELRAAEQQCLHYADTTPGDLDDDRVECTTIDEAENHEEHAHYHHRATGSYELLAADPETEQLREISTSPKAGFCIGDYLIARWHRFDQDPHRTSEQYTNDLSCAGNPTPTRTRFGLTKGWGDVYPGFVEGNYVDYGAVTDSQGQMVPGHYVIRATTNPCRDPNVGVTDQRCRGTIIETRYNDNTGYAYFEIVHDVSGKALITEIERGHGQSPFDHSRTGVHDNRRFLLPDAP